MEVILDNLDNKNLGDEPSWSTILGNEKEKPYFIDLLHRVAEERASGKSIFPPPKDVFNSLKFTPFQKVKVVLLGQDPYIQLNQAHGLSFSVRKGISFPPSLVNIFKELSEDVGCTASKDGDLTHWADQGVLLLNSVLTVEAGKSGSHANFGWQIFSDAIIQAISLRKSNVVFLLWGAYAQKKALGVDRTKHLCLTAAHPSPFSAHKGFFGCRHFSQTNQFLVSHHNEPIKWCSLS